MTPLERLADMLNEESKTNRMMTKAVRQPKAVFSKARQSTKPEPLFKSIAAGQPTRGDLAKAQEVLAAMRGKVPANEIARMDVQLRMLAWGCA